VAKVRIFPVCTNAPQGLVVHRLFSASAAQVTKAISNAHAKDAGKLEAARDAATA